MPVSKHIDSLSDSDDDVGRTMPKSMKAMKVVKAMKAMKSRQTRKKPVVQTRRTKAGVWESLLSDLLLISMLFLPGRK